MDKAVIGICLSQPQCRSKVTGVPMLRAALSLDGVEERDEEQEDDGEEDLRDGGIPFIVNRGGLPVNEETWEQMWRHVARIHPDGAGVEKKIRGATDLPKVPILFIPFHSLNTNAYNVIQIFAYQLFLYMFYYYLNTLQLLHSSSLV